MEFLQTITPIIPMIVLIVLIVWTKRIMESSIVTLILAYLLVSPKDILTNLPNGLLTTLVSDTYSFVLAAASIMGIFVRLMIESGGTIGFGKLLGRFANNRKKSLVATFILGLIVFIDEYLNALVVTSSMRNLTDKYKAPRLMLACTVNSAGVPACIFAPISIWAIYYIGLISDSGLLEGTELTGLQMYVRVIPYMVYPAIFMVIILLLALDIFPKYGPMKKAYQRAEETGDVFPESGCVGVMDDDIKEGNVAFFLIPMITIILIAYFTGDIFVAVLIGVAVISAMLILSKKMTVSQVGDAITEGVKDMVFILVLLLILFTFTEICSDIGFAELVVNAVSSVLSGWMVPPVMFIIISLLSWIMGSYWATSALCMPIMIQLAEQMDLSMPLMLGILISGAVCPATCSFTSEALVMSSQSAQVQPAEMGLANLPYAFTALGISTVIFGVLGVVL
ncbi:MAG: Na+/H+ antiporter NhaC family protein [Emergencia timonensis]|uniref:Na+/H+ antiporter NhaC family protein n=1 Tax=Emergencia timonensis TaxID=1776384 RepID=UPI00082AB92F|nr:Na+/H+ antiporter NhaC family protein [Emergencia timonensis]WNX90596.1 Na+/H+ antiporter NhaC family protein [Emergencia timonensis]